MAPDDGHDEEQGGGSRVSACIHLEYDVRTKCLSACQLMCASCHSPWIRMRAMYSPCMQTQRAQKVAGIGACGSRVAGPMCMTC